MNIWTKIYNFAAEEEEHNTEWIEGLAILLAVVSLCNDHVWGGRRKHFYAVNYRGDGNIHGAIVHESKKGFSDVGGWGWIIGLFPRLFWFIIVAPVVYYSTECE